MSNRDDDTEGNLSSRRRFSSGGHLQSSTTAALTINKPPTLGDSYGYRIGFWRSIGSI
ncbi:hypothetical protein TELCIR_03491 [Teladorsagia circumcincta]|uniref:Uncharacterized protein n=1 Tax=Teladorsagia circumcincta TaxID=45464 RepID=A0A2G9UW73_TELCI|nr:hypothetical protein TELCIR_03491 [Teladorsagia circumcincta]